MRYTAEFRGGDWDDKPWEWCVIDEHDGLFGAPTDYDLTKEQALLEAHRLNTLNKETT